MQRKFLILCATLVLIIMMMTFVGCVWVKDYPLVESSFLYEIDDSIPFVSLDNAPTTNERRGFRGESYINLGEDEAYPGSGEPWQQHLDEQLSLYAADDIRIMQVYVYIGKFYDSDITSEAFSELLDYFNYIDSKDIKVLLRFAYETGSSTDGPRTKDIERHAKQIKAFIDDNDTLFHKVVYAVQLGMIGLWGEGHGAKHNIDVKRVIKAVADMVPSDIPIMVRTPKMLRKVPKNLEHRFGVHDDFLVGYDHEWGMMSFDDKNYPKLLTKCKYTITDAEMPWGKAEERVDMMGVIEQCVGYGLTSLSIAHNYKEDDKVYLLEKWKDEYLTIDDMKSHHFPYNPNLLNDGKISVYNYLKHHLGYQIVASNLHIENGRCDFMLTNFGFAMPYGYEMKIYANGKEVKPYRSFDDEDLIEYGQQIYCFDYTSGDIEIMLYNRNDSNDTIRLYNDVPYANGRNKIYVE